MKLGFYRRLAWSGIKKNKRLYLPYLLTSIGVVAMFYIVSYLTDSPVITQLKGGGVMKECMLLGQWVILVFAAIFLFYTNSFLTRRRRREFGLYNMLGMDKHGVGRVLLSETVIVYILSMTGGLALGVAFSKFAELLFLRIAKYDDVTYDLHLSTASIYQTLAFFAVIFAVILFFAILGVHKSTATELLKSENVGEKPPKANWLFGLAGVVILAAAYWLAVRIEQPLVALLTFFVAVVMVIVATYLLFIAGSVLLCRILQRKRKYYYNPRHFVTVSSMVYRMKRNGAGLASICILCTMVLVMLCATSSLYFGSEAALNAMYPRDFIFEIHTNRWEELTADEIGRVRGIVDELMKSHGAAENNPIEYRYTELSGVLEDGVFDPDYTALTTFDMSNYDEVLHVVWVPTEDYNRQLKNDVRNEIGGEIRLADDEVMIYSIRNAYDGDTLVFGDHRYRVVEKLERFDLGKNSLGDVIPTLIVIANDVEKAVSAYDDLADYYGTKFVHYYWNWCFDMDVDYETTEKINESFMGSEIWTSILNPSDTSRVIEGCTYDFREMEGVGYYSFYGGIFFLGILLSVVFLFGTVLIIYYKQVSEGYEDQARYAIMKKVGMTRQEIKRSVNSQIVMVFFAPLGMAVLHLAFAFPMIRKLLLLFGLNELILLLGVTGIGVLAFAVFYLLVYRATSGAYLSIVNSAEKE